MSGKVYRWLIAAASVVLAVALGIFLGRSSSGHKGERGREGVEQLVLSPKAHLPSEDARWTFAPDVPLPIGHREQRREIVHWTIREAQSEIAPGVIYDDAWGFEGRVPGPLLRVRVGDLVEVHLRNALNSLRTHNIDFHFVMGPGGGASALSVAPGEEAVLEARATAPGFYMFHCATPDIPMHIANGMYGFVLVEPEEGLPAVGKELYVVQSEIYTTDDKPGHKSFDMVRADKADPQYVVFNGSVGALLKDQAPIAMQNETVRIYVGNAGPNLISSFHVIGQIFDKVYREGDLLSPPARSLQTTLIPAGGSAVVEFTPPVPGTFLLVDHAIFRLHHGAAGSINVQGQENAEVFEPKTPRNMVPMSEDAHLGHGSHEMVTPARAPFESGVHFAMSAPAPELKATNGVTIKMLPGSGIWKKGPMQTFGPKTVTIKAGQSVIFKNADIGMAHSVFGEKGEFASPMLAPGATYEKRFDQKGVVHFQCAPHPWMKGTIIVK
ncbi:MAG: multicopper oxidase domain-containing protein [Acidobacteria bacterium]|nr:multicopper oxidase domain-containing protein [Acidobacteriota bacterium]MBS1864498.1 multicopper oxidase domain-containing protein [Acidobacteriota bacterium]